MRTGPVYRVVIGGTDAETVRLDGFGGEADDPVAATVMVAGVRVVDVVAPADRPTWGEATETRFRNAVRELAATHDWCRERDAVTVRFDPPAADPPPGREVETAAENRFRRWKFLGGRAAPRP